jgi:hypothetical protein
LNTDPYFACEAQETFTEGARIYAHDNTHVVRAGAEGVYLGRLTERQAAVAWDTPSGEEFRETVGFGKIRNLDR